MFSRIIKKSAVRAIEFFAIAIVATITWLFLRDKIDEPGLNLIVFGCVAILYIICEFFILPMISWQFPEFEDWT